MSNPSTVAGFVGVGTIRNTFPVQTVATATETILAIGTDSGTASFYLSVPSATAASGASNIIGENDNSAITTRSGREYGLPSGQAAGFTTNSIAPGHPFKVRVSGTGNAGAVALQTIQVNLYQGSSATVGTNKKIGTTGTAFAAVAGGPFNFYIEATLFWDATSGILSGSYAGNIAFAATSQFVPPTVITTVVTSVTAATLVFNATLALGVAASSTIQLTEFVIDEV